MMGFVLFAIVCLMQWVASTTFCASQELRPSLIGEDIKGGRKKRELDELRRSLL